MMNRREHDRHTAYVPTDVAVGGSRGRPAMTQDVSRGGLLMLTRATTLEVGQTISVQLHVDGQVSSITTGTIVRATSVARGPWNYEVAARFDSPESTTFEQHIAELSKLQMDIYGTGPSDNAGDSENPTDSPSPRWMPN